MISEIIAGNEVNQTHHGKLFQNVVSLYGHMYSRYLNLFLLGQHLCHSILFLFIEQKWIIMCFLNGHFVFLCLTFYLRTLFHYLLYVLIKRKLIFFSCLFRAIFGKQCTVTRSYSS